MEGGTINEFVTGAIIAAAFAATVLLLIVAIRRARKARQRQIEGVDEESPKPVKKRSALVAEDVVGDAGPAAARADQPSGEIQSPKQPLEAEEAPSPVQPEPAVSRAPVSEAADTTTPHPPAVSPVPAKPDVALPQDKPRVSEAEARPKIREAGALAPGLARTRAGWVSRLGQIFAGKREIDPSLVEEIEKVLLTADIGVRTSQKLLEEIRSSLSRRELADSKAVWDFLRRRSIELLRVESPPLDFGKTKPFVLLAIGVNGSGKTTTIGKLASKLKANGKSVLLAAGDTFRAAATEQLEVWGARVGAPVVRGKEGGDPSSVIFDGIKRATSEGVDVVIADTAGRLHTKTNLMDELQKVRRVASKALEGAPHETWLVIDATSGQNAIAQAQIFTQAMAVTGIVLTKLDGTAKGGVILGITDQLGIPVRYVGIGERVEDLREFDAEEFVEALFEDVDRGSL
jgi:fused signal recognition particle receptor